MKIPALTIPSAFVRLDTNVNAHNSFANVRDLQRVRLNHNILLARRIRKVLFNHAWPTSNTGVALADFGPTFFAFGKMWGNLATPLVSVPLHFTQDTKSIKVVLWGNVPAGGSSVDLYAKITAPTEIKNIFEGSPAVTLTSAAFAQHTFDVFLSKQARTRLSGVLTISMAGGLDGTAVGGPYTPSDWGPDWVKITGSPSPGWFLYAGTNLSIQPRYIVRVETFPAGVTKAYVDAPWNVVLSSMDTLSARLPLRVQIGQILAYEEALTDFSIRDSAYSM